MKDVYVNYLGKMREIEQGISDEDRKVLEEFQRFCELSAGNEKVEQRKRHILQFLDIIEKPFSEFNRSEVEHIYLLIKNSDRETSGKNEVIKHLKYFIRWLKDDENLLKGLKPVTQRKGYNTEKLNPSTLPTKEEFHKLVSVAKESPMHLSMITLQSELALRPCELLNLTWRDIKIKEGIGEVKVFSPKTKETRTLPFKDSVEVLLKWKSVYPFPNRTDKDLVFPGKSREQQLYRSYLSQLYRRLSKKAGLRHLYPYLFRHKRLTEINKECPSKVASGYGGHSEKTASVYTHLSEADIREVVMKTMYDLEESKISKSQLEQIKFNHEEIVKKVQQQEKLQKKSDAILKQLIKTLKTNKE